MKRVLLSSAASFLMSAVAVQADAQTEIRPVSASEVRAAGAVLNPVSASAPSTERRRIYGVSSWGAPPIEPRLVNRAARPVEGANVKARHLSIVYDPEAPRHAGGIPISTSPAVEPSLLLMVEY